MPTNDDSHDCHVSTRFIATTPGGETAQEAAAFLNEQGVVTEAVALDSESLVAVLTAGVSGDEEIELEIEVAQRILDRVCGVVRFESKTDPRDLVALINESTEVGASVVYAVGFEGHGGFMPGTDPIPVSGELSSGSDRIKGDYIGVIDSGLAPKRDTWMEDPLVKITGASDIEQIAPDASHGTFVTGVIRQIAPNHGVWFARALPVDKDEFSPPLDPVLKPSATFELQVARAIGRLLISTSNSGDRIVALNLSLGIYTCTPDDPPPLVMRNALKDWLSEHTSVLCSDETGTEIFASGGNIPGDDAVWPAAFRFVRGVAAAECRGERQIVWNSGAAETAANRWWISDIAPGEDIVGLSGVDATDLVRWSGSSFASAVASASYAAGHHKRYHNGQTWWSGRPILCSDIPGLTEASSGNFPDR